MQPSVLDESARPDAVEERTDVAATRRRWSIRIRYGGRVRGDLLAITGYLLGALWVTAHLWLHAKHRVLTVSPTNHWHGDQFLFEYWLAHAAQTVTSGMNPFFDNHVNAPLGVNLMANTPAPGLTVPLAPLTLLWGPPVAYAVVVVLAPFSTALAWYWLFSRHLVASLPAALIGGAICGFGPGIVAQTNAHPNIATQFVVPLIVWRTIRLAQDERYVRNGLVLGALVAYQAFINEEILLFTAIGMVIFCGAFAVSRPGPARSCIRRFSLGLSVAGGLALAVLAYPLWYQFFGPQHYNGLGPDTYRYGTDLFAFTAYPTHSLAGNADTLKLALFATEQNTYFGWALLVQVAVIAVAMWRNVAARCATVTAVVLGVLSLGTHLRVNGQYLSMWGPWRPLAHLPVFDSVICTRLTLLMLPPVAFLVALAIDKVRSYDVLRQRRDLRLMLFGGLAAALLPLVPTPLPATGRPPTPAFIGSGQWRSYVAPGRTLVSIPLNTEGGVLAMQWSAAQRLAFTMPGGYFLGPDPASPDGSATFGAAPGPTASIWNAAAQGDKPTVRPADRVRAQQDLRYWRAGVVILAPQPNAAILREVTTQLLGFAPSWVGGVWLWELDSHRE